MQISVLDDLLDSVRHLQSVQKLAAHRVTIWNDHTTDVDVLAQRLKDAEVLVLMRERTPIHADLLARLPRLKMISQISVYPHIDIAACTRHGVVVCSNLYPGAPRFTTLHATAELTWALLMSAMRRLPEQMASLRQGRWQTRAGLNLRGRTLGVWGYGRIGQVVAGYGKAFGMRVWVWGSADSRARAVADGYQAADSVDAFFSQSDVVSLHLRLNDHTRAIVTARELGLMKTSGVLVNTSRAGLIAPGALHQALVAARPGMAAIDVFDHEPVTDVHDPLLQLPNLVATPHIGYVEMDSLEDQFSEIFEQVLLWQAGQPVHVVNPLVLAQQAQQPPGQDGENTSGVA